MTLSELLQGVSVSKMFQTMYGKMVTTHDVKVSGIQYDSRKVQRENLFVALKGGGADGHKFLSSAIANGAKVIVVEDDNSIPDPMCMHTGTVKIVVSNTRKALAQISANYYGRPAEKMTMIGVTGTNGKTTTTFLIKQMLEADEANKVGLIGTVEYAIGEEKFPATHTTPESLEMHQLFAQMVQKGCTHCVMEVSSHALHQYRAFGIPFSAAVFTNLTQDHLDYHGTMEEYFSAKKILFEGLSPTATAVVNADSEYGMRIVEGCAATVTSYSIEKPSKMKAEQLSISINGFSAVIHGEKVAPKLVGRFNVYNFLAAYSVVKELGVFCPPELYAQLSPAPGRFDQIQSKRGWTAIVDYAHTPDALENCLQTIHDVLPFRTKSKIITVFGAGGDRDKSKRPLMGRIAERLSDAMIVTSDNPRTEDPMEIISDILEGIDYKIKVIVESDRAKAIAHGLSIAKNGDVVLVAGKGHEDYQVIGKEKIHFSDKEEVMKSVNNK
ncbi:MAG: UDP-N-acetylmuramoyl-L-alanyl-D-glutamate--2,6-diaminopimelate ligase [Bacteroidetes bacterium]|nr:UDP-N-acetylmuramoyl-L-alanyl-D-glutamate--2,6-diaminopimelate ligase [Bacteroidota bacterium]